MTKLSRKFMGSDKIGLYVNNLWSAFTLAENKEEIKSLFRDLFTHTEYKMFAKRFEIARRLLERQSYEEIIREMNVTERTIANINNILAEKGEGFRKIHTRLANIEQQIREKEYSKLERLSRYRKPVLAGEKVIPEMITAGLSFTARKFAQHKKRLSAGKNLK